MSNILALSILVMVSLFLVVTLDLLALGAARKGWLPHSSFSLTLILGLIILMGSSFFLLGVSRPWLFLKESPALLKVSGAFLFLAGTIVYMELRSLFSRGFTFRILADLVLLGGQSSIPDLKKNYGRGVGLSGMLYKRLDTLSKFKLIHLDKKAVGPLTPLGRTFAILGRVFRNALRLDVVG